MCLYVQCAYCGEWFTLTGVQIFAGRLPCPCCSDLGLMIPETDLTPKQDPRSVDDEYQILRVNGE